MIIVQGNRNSKRCISPSPIFPQTFLQCLAQNCSRLSTVNGRLAGYFQQVEISQFRPVITAPNKQTFLSLHTTNSLLSTRLGLTSCNRQDGTVLNKREVLFKSANCEIFQLTRLPQAIAVKLMGKTE